QRLIDAERFAHYTGRAESHIVESWIAFGWRKPSPVTALAALDEQLNHPVDEAVASWSTRMPSVPLAFDPAHPDEAMPLAYVDSRLHFEPANWIVLAIAGGMGLVFWMAAMRMLLANM